MSKPITDAELEQLLKETTPLLAKMGGPPLTIPERIIAALDKAMDEVCPVVRKLTSEQMRALILKVVSEKPMNGFDLITCLEKARFRLLEVGDGAIYGLLNSMESAGNIEGEWRESGGRMLKYYRITNTGTGLLQSTEEAITHLNVWSASVLALDSSGT